MRSADLLDEWNVAGLVGSLKIPFSWIDEAKVSHHSTRIAVVTTPKFPLLIGHSRAL